MWAPQCHVTGDNLHTCALICSAVGGLILSHYCRRCQHTPIAHMAARVSVLPSDHAGCVFHQPGLLSEQYRKTKLLSWALAKMHRPYGSRTAEEKYRKLYYRHLERLRKQLGIQENRRQVKFKMEEYSKRYPSNVSINGQTAGYCNQCM